ncbi:MAG: hypothetical protein ABI954_02840 [Pyrinomonadaceae bacterium]
MKIPVKIINRKSFGLLLLSIGFVGGLAINADAQVRDPFAKPIVRVIKQKITVGVIEKKKVVGPGVVAPPPIQSRIDGYRAVRQRCAELGVPCPKPTSVLTLDEMQVTGIFRTPRGYAAMVEASPLNPKLSYTIYPGEKFYDGQLVAIEDTRLVFRRITRMTDGKEIIASADKVLRQDTINDLAASRSDVQPLTNSTNTTTTVSETGSVPQMSAEAVPITDQNQAAGAAVKETKGNPQGLQPNKIEPSDENQAAKTTAPDANTDSDAGSVPAKAKTKAKSKPKNNK